MLKNAIIVIVAGLLVAGCPPRRGPPHGPPPGPPPPRLPVAHVKDATAGFSATVDHLVWREPT
jgi:hypothetical protein